MADKRICDECATELPPNAPEGLCPRCLVGMGINLALAGASAERTLAATEILPAKSRVSTLRQFGDYELVEEIARGGMG